MQVVQLTELAAFLFDNFGTNAAIQLARLLD